MPRRWDFDAYVTAPGWRAVPRGIEFEPRCLVDQVWVPTSRPQLAAQFRRFGMKAGRRYLKQHWQIERSRKRWIDKHGDLQAVGKRQNPQTVVPSGRPESSTTWHELIPVVSRRFQERFGGH